MKNSVKAMLLYAVATGPLVYMIDNFWVHWITSSYPIIRFVVLSSISGLISVFLVSTVSLLPAQSHAPENPIDAYLNRLHKKFIRYLAAILGIVLYMAYFLFSREYAYILVILISSIHLMIGITSRKLD